MELLAHVCYLIGIHGFVYLVVSMLLLFGVGLTLGGKAPAWLARLLLANVVLAFANVFVGSALATRLLYRVGTPGRAEVVSSYGTGGQYNNQNVRGYLVLLRTQPGQTIETSFEDDDFNVYPPHNAVTYPGVGDTFTARYLPTFPHDFIIVSDDDSPWATQLRCQQQLDDLHEARTKHEFDLHNETYKQAYLAAIQRIIAGRCYADSLDLQKYYGDIEQVRQGR